MTSTRVDKMITWVRNNRITSIFIFLFILVVGLATLVTSVRTIREGLFGTRSAVQDSLSKTKNKPGSIKKDDISETIFNWRIKNSLRYHNSAYAPCLSFDAIGIPKEYKEILFLDGFKLGGAGREQMEVDLKDILNNLAANDVISMNKVRDTSYLNSLGRPINVKTYFISLSEKGKPLLIGQTGDVFIFPFYATDRLEIIKNERKGDDTLVVTYKVFPTILRDILDKVCKYKQDNYLPSDTGKANLIKQQGVWTMGF